MGKQVEKGKIIVSYVGDPKYFVGVVAGDVLLDHRENSDEHIIEIDMDDCHRFVLRINAEGIENKSLKIGRMYSKRK